ncbi:hypothetical protein FOA52_011108 [Chlamydomonas sp. UWO 241]|nr:hypothetical protein FOA52_011108 [Chlamydomonas sp. UWO 241]
MALVASLGGADSSPMLQCYIGQQCDSCDANDVSCGASGYCAVWDEVNSGARDNSNVPGAATIYSSWQMCESAQFVKRICFNKREGDNGGVANNMIKGMSFFWDEDASGQTPYKTMGASTRPALMRSADSSITISQIGSPYNTGAGFLCGAVGVAVDSSGNNPGIYSLGFLFLGPVNTTKVSYQSASATTLDPNSTAGSAASANSIECPSPGYSAFCTAVTDTDSVSSESTSELSREDTHSLELSFTQGLSVGAEGDVMTVEATVGFGETYTDTSSLTSMQTMSQTDWTGKMTYYLKSGATFTTTTSGTMEGSYYTAEIDMIIVCTAPDGSIVCTPTDNQVCINLAAASRRRLMDAETPKAAAAAAAQASACPAGALPGLLGRLSHCAPMQPSVPAEVFCAGVPPEYLPGSFAAPHVPRGHYTCSADGSATLSCCPPGTLFYNGSCSGSEPPQYESYLNLLATRSNSWRVCDGDRIPVCSASRVDAQAIDPDMPNTTKTVSAVTTTACTYAQLRKRALCKSPSNMYICTSVAGQLFAPGYGKTGVIISCP